MASKYTAKTFLAEIENLVREIDNDWNCTKVQLETQECESFVDISTKVLKNYKVNNDFSLDTFEELCSMKLPELHYKVNRFSDHPLTIYRGANYFIDLYFWNKSITDIHDHHFCGAFKVLQGKGTNFCYEYQELKKIDDVLSQGNLILKDKRELRPNDVESIHFAQYYIHQNFHPIGEKTINLCVRTLNQKSYAISEYYIGGHKVEHHKLTAELQDKLQKLFKCFESQDFDAFSKILKESPLEFKYILLNLKYALSESYPFDFIEFCRDQAGQFIKHISPDHVNFFEALKKSHIIRAKFGQLFT